VTIPDDTAPAPSNMGTGCPICFLTVYVIGRMLTFNINLTWCRMAGMLYLLRPEEILFLFNGFGPSECFYLASSRWNIRSLDLMT
jgi:hypothetical protein